MTATTYRGTAAPRDRLDEAHAPPIVAAVDGSASSRAAIGEAVRLAGELEAPLVFAYVRRGPNRLVGAPFYQRLLTKEMARARRVLGRALAIAADSGVSAEAEILEGSPWRRIAAFARDRRARLVVVGTRDRALRRSVSRGVVRAAGRPVVVARGVRSLAAVGS
jgi:nucleotide-binding universal stress UspA family protein